MVWTRVQGENFRKLFISKIIRIMSNRSFIKSTASTHFHESKRIQEKRYTQLVLKSQKMKQKYIR